MRGLSAEAARDFAEVSKAHFFTAALTRGDIVGTRVLDQPPAPQMSDWELWLEHDRVPFLNYPFEWSFSMLREAALLQLRLQEEALEAGFTCKDATPYNVQFVGSRPVFIDVGSFEVLREGEPWVAYRQFCEMYLYPLMFRAYKDVPFQPFLRGSVDGVTAEVARKVLSGWKRSWKGMLVHVEMHALAQRRMASTDQDMRRQIAGAGMRRDLVLASVRKMRSLVESLEWRRSESTWSTYSDRSHYGSEDLRVKAEFVRSVASSGSWNLVWDLGANDGYFSRMLTPHASYVLAVDSDELVVDHLWRDLRREGEAKILPLVMDLADLCGGLGWRGRERRSFLERGHPDLVVALALVHHLSISANVPLEEVVAFLCALGEHLVVEFPQPNDPMVLRLLRNKRPGLHDDYSQPTFEKALEASGRVLERRVLPSGNRVLYHVECKRA